MDNQVSNPYLSAGFAPVQNELDVKSLPITGEIPSDLQGVYMRNGPNPKFPPIEYHYPFDGDGMIHGVYFDKQQASYKNRFVMTYDLQAEIKANRALFGSVFNPIMPDQKYFDYPVSPFKDGAFIHVIKHADFYLALHEAAPAYEINRELETLGMWNPSRDNPINVNAHTRLDPKTGELFLITYDVKPPYLTYYVLDKAGKLICTRAIEKPYGSMIHDFLLSENYLIIVDSPILFGDEAAGPFLQWKPELQTRIGLIPRSSEQQSLWLETSAFFVFHFINAYEDQNQLVLDYAAYNDFPLFSKQKDSGCHLTRMMIDLSNKQIKTQKLNSLNIEFMRINDNYQTLPYQYCYAVDMAAQRHRLLKFDMKKHSMTHHDFGESCEISEPIFAPKKNPVTEDDGYILSFVYDKAKDSSVLVILNAKDIAAKPLALVHLPQRVPHGLHGSWMAS